MRNDPCGRQEVDTLASLSLNFDAGNLNVHQGAILLNNSIIIHNDERKMILMEKASLWECCVPFWTTVPPTSSSTALRLAMDLFQHRYYRLNKTLMRLIGQWPQQSTRSRRGIVAVLIVIGVSQFVPLMMAFAKYRHDWRIVLDCLMPSLFSAVCTTKFIGFMWNPEKTLELLNRICTDWRIWARDREVIILHKYAAQGETITVAYTAAIFAATFIFMTEPVVPKIIDVLLRNGTKPGLFPFPLYYYNLNMQKYYFYIVMNSCACVCMAEIVIVASDIMLIVYIQHVCGVFAAMGHKLERIFNNGTTLEKHEWPYSLDNWYMLELASCIVRHNDAIEYAELIEASYTWSFFFNIGIGVATFAVSGLQIVTGTADLEATAKFMMFLLAVLFQYYIECHFSEILMDHSMDIRFYIYHSQWYGLSLKAQKLLPLMIMRCNVPCQLTAGKMTIMSVKTFGQMVKTGISYFTLARSMHRV